MPISKIVNTFDEAIADIPDEAVILVGGFAGPGECPSCLIAAIARKNTRNLTLVSNLGGWGLKLIPTISERMRNLIKFPDNFVDHGLLVEQNQVKKGIFAYPAAPSRSIFMPIEHALTEHKAELELVPQGTLAERIRGAKGGIAAIYTPVGPGTTVEDGKEIRKFDGRPYLLERSLKGDFSLIRAHKADRYGNLIYKGTSRTFNATMAGASTITIAEVDEIVDLGELDPESIVTPGIYVQRVVVRPRQLPVWRKPL